MQFSLAEQKRMTNYSFSIITIFKYRHVTGHAILLSRAETYD